MKYSIKPYIHNEDLRYQTLFTEIHKFDLDELDRILTDMSNVFEGKYTASSINGEVVSSIEFDKDISKILYYDEIIGEEPTVEIYNMFMEYRNAIIKYENKQT